MMNRLPPLRALCTRSDHRKLHPRQIEPCDLMAPVRRQGAVPGPPRWGSSYRSGTGCSRCRLAASLRRSYPPWADRPQPSATSLAIMNGHSGQPRINILPGSCCNLRATAYRDPVAAVVEDLELQVPSPVFSFGLRPLLVKAFAPAPGELGSVDTVYDGRYGRAGKVRVHRIRAEHFVPGRCAV